MSSPVLVPRPPALLFGLPIADVTMSETLDRIGEMVRRGRATGRSHQVATVNVDFMVNALEDATLAEILRGADLCLADGTPIVWMANAFGMPIAERVAGSDLVPLLFDRSQTTGWRIHVFGSSADVARRAEELIRADYPLATVTFEPGPTISDVDVVDDDVLRAIAEVDADIVCVALGNPKQERFIRAHRERLGAPVMIGIGGSIDMLVGERTRAPSWMQRIGLEWVARAVQEPRRLGRRYAHDIRVMAPRLSTELRRSRDRRAGAGLTLQTSAGEVRVVIERGRPDADEWARAVARLETRDRDDVRLVIDPGSVTAVSDACAAHLVGLVQIARQSQRSVVWLHGAERLSACLEALGVGHQMLGVDSW